MPDPAGLGRVELFQRPAGDGISSIGVRFAPLSAVERSLLNTDRMLRAASTRRAHPAFGEHSKLLALRRGEAVELTVAAPSAAFLYSRNGALLQWNWLRHVRQTRHSQRLGNAG